MERKPLDVSGVLAVSLEAITAQCAAKGISLARDFPSGPWPLLGDETRLRQVFDNLLRNAVEAQPEGGMIVIVGHMDKGRLVLDLKDSGPGIPPERQTHLFDFGHSTKPGGSGIGLPLSQLIIEAHDGSLRYISENGEWRGAIFRITLPLNETHL
jgi:signal transduction histidine kinase